MKENAGLALMVIALGIISFSCSSLKPALSEIPPADIDRTIYFCDDGWKARRINDSTGIELYSGGIDFTLLPLGEPAPFESSISRFGNFLATRHNKIRVAHFNRSLRETEFGIYDIRKNEFVLELSAWKDMRAGTYHVQWSMLDSAFFYVDSDTVKRCYPNGCHTSVISRDGIRTFSVSPSEERIVIAATGGIWLYNVRQHREELISTLFDSWNGIRGLSWSSDEDFVVFASGRKVYVYDVNKNSLMVYGADDSVYYTEWLPDTSLIYVEGFTASEMAQIRTSDWFRICKLDLQTGGKSILHERNRHEPFSVRPRLSPSGKLLLFSERKLKGGYEVKLMSLDGRQMNTICDGSDPCWGK